MTELKASHGAELGEAAITIGDLLPPGIMALGSRATMRIMDRLPDISIGTVTTNVPGPQIALYALGREMLAYYPYVPIVHGVPVGVAILSYNGRIAFGVTGDYDRVPDLDVLIHGIEYGIDELAGAARDHASNHTSVGPPPPR
jgi:hypothetical protein